MTLYFYNLGHNGDIHHTREYVRDIINKTSYDKYVYLSENIKNCGNLLKDIKNLEFGFLDDNCINGLFTNPNYIYNHSVLRIDNDTCYIKVPINIDFNVVHFIFKNIYDELQIVVEQPNFYEPKIDYSIYNTSGVDAYLENNINKLKVLVSNGPIRSFQSGNVDFTKLLDSLSNDFPNVDFITTDKINIVKDNVTCTSDIIKNEGCDLMEISYLSTFCNILIGRSSSPSTQMLVKDNLRDINKTIIFIVFALSAGIYYYDTPVNKIWIKNIDYDNVYNTIKCEIERKTQIDRIVSIKKNIDNKIYVEALQPLDDQIEIRFYRHHLHENLNKKIQDDYDYCYHHLILKEQKYWVIPYAGYSYKDKIKIRMNYKNSLYVKVF